jgi:hypothetical protein
MAENMILTLTIKFDGGSKMIVSKPVRVTVEIEDETTKCTYLYSGKCIKDCEDYFKSLFLNDRKYKIIYVNVL